MSHPSRELEYGEILTVQAGFLFYIWKVLFCFTMKFHRLWGCLCPSPRSLLLTLIDFPSNFTMDAVIESILTVQWCTLWHVYAYDFGKYFNISLMDLWLFRKYFNGRINSFCSSMKPFNDCMNYIISIYWLFSNTSVFTILFQNFRIVGNLN